MEVRLVESHADIATSSLARAPGIAAAKLLRRRDPGELAR
jgi:hypothetical protein